MPPVEVDDIRGVNFMVEGRAYWALFFLVAFFYLYTTYPQSGRLHGAKSHGILL